jgi:hypothetical protein
LGFSKSFIDIRHIVLFIIEFLNPVWKLLIKEAEIKEPVLLYQNAQLAKCPADKIAHDL